MLFFISPISGGSFPCQLALMTELNMDPDVCLGASGGNVAHYLWLACNKDIALLQKIVLEINRDMFIKGDKFSAILRGHFLPGDGVTSLFRKIFDQKEIARFEIITLACDDDLVRPTLFSNKSQQDSFFKDQIKKIDEILYQVDGVQFLNQDVDKASIISMASASIPGIVAPQSFENNSYVDGGVCYASAFTPLSGYIQEKIHNEKIEPLQLIHFSCYNMEKIADIEKNVPKMLKRLLDSSHFSALQDRAKVVELFSFFNQNVKAEHYQKTNKHELRRRLDELKDTSYCVILYPEDYPEINILNFQPSDILKVMQETIANYSFYLWYQDS